MVAFASLSVAVSPVRTITKARLPVGSGTSSR